MKVSEPWLIQSRHDFGLVNVALDDLVDALVCLFTASCIRDGNSEPLGHSDKRDDRNLVMEIVRPKVAAVL